MRRQIIVMFFSLFWLTAPGHAAAKAGEPSKAPAPVAAPASVQSGALAAPPAAPRQRGALFKVQGGGHTLYLFGTMHVGLPDFYPLEPVISGAIAHATTLALEVDPTRDPAAIAGAMQQHGMFAPGSAGYKDMPPALADKLARVLAARHMELAGVAGLKPWLLATVLALGEFAQQGYRADLAVDSHLAQLAHVRHLPVLELETVQSQLSLFSRLSAAEQWRFLDDAIDAIENGKQADQVREVVDAWSTADQAGLEAIAAKAAEDQTFSGQFIQHVMLDERNGPLANKLAQLLGREANSVAAIGVLHLVGKTSVPQLLRARGLTVERVY
ncbi:MAG: TraB/GumN family protein [Pseudomonadota bacterium]